MKKVLEELTLYMAGDRRFYIAFYPKEDVITNDHIQASDIDRVDLMQATDDEKVSSCIFFIRGSTRV